MLADDVRWGLEARPRSLPPKYFYGHAGSVLFECITELPEYYLTRVEEAIIRDVAREVVNVVPSAPGWPASESGTLCHGDGARTGPPHPEGVHVEGVWEPGPTGSI